MIEQSIDRVINIHLPIKSGNNMSELAKKRITAEDVFRVALIGVSLILSLCVKGILEFRQFCQQNNYYVFAAESMAYCIVGFVMAWVEVTCYVGSQVFFLLLDDGQSRSYPATKVRGRNA
jgi:hypothetical protein